ncbi:MAG TPA: cob(I)yrinic acid a,c-diamide adenosyltransferase [Chitinophagaceae bacterium]|nr:cob(I)yrinic acid a,c-diamide adenosyltransferase [Chitinophagaceae bacterium]
MALKIYTRTGDLGKTSLIGGTKVPKSHPRIEAYGNVDELNSHIGLVRDYQSGQAIRDELNTIQDRLFTIGSSLACDPQKETKMRIPDLREEDILQLEKAIDRMNEQLPGLTAFIHPGGHVSVSVCHIARCICRRSERTCVQLLEQREPVSLLVIKYLNRLSDYLFILARWTARQGGTTEIIWKPREENPNPI